MCICDIVCSCQDNGNQTDSPPLTDAMATVKDASVGACLLGKTRPHDSHVATADQLNLFNILNDYRTYAYTLSPKEVGIMAGKSRDKQYETLKRLHSEVLSSFRCSYIINIEIYPGSDNNLHCHGMIRFPSHTIKENFKKLLKDKITLYRKGTYSNLIDCEFVNSFETWSNYIMKSQNEIVSKYSYFPFIKIDYSFHQYNLVPQVITVPVSSKTRMKTQKSLEDKLIKAQSKVDKLLSQLNSLKTLNNNI